MTKKKPDAQPLAPVKCSHRLSVRITEEDYEKLCELRLALHLGSDNQVVRALIRLHHSQAAREAIRKARRDPQHADRLEAVVHRSQLPLFGGAK